ncbi:MAG TPA: SOS response-associated peptidase [Candidatus Dormibacteraeota bacterium]|nr:SOS response-associated peptidase [Candidatus Dormibacteraeota bacterium]
MCGRVVQKTPMSEIRVLFETVNPVPNAAPTYNGAPTDTLPVVRLDRDGRRSLDLLRWGLVPWWSKDIKMGVRCINAMAETIATKPAFRDAFARGQRCIVPVDGFYEWKKSAAGKQPYAIVSGDGLPLAMAGLWERWKDRAAGDTVQTFTIITTVPNELCGAIHDRMPVMLPRDKWATWLGERDAETDELRWMILRPYPADQMRAYPVDARVGNVRNNDARLFEPVNIAA